MDQDENWHAGRPRPWPHVVRWDTAHPRKEAQQPPLSKFTGAGFACVRIILNPCLLWPNGWMDQDQTWQEVGLYPGHICYMGTQPPSPKGALLAPNFRPMPVVAIRLDGSRWHLAGGRPRPRPHCVRWGRSSPSPKGVQPPIFGPCLLWLNGRPSQLLLSTCPTNLGPTGCYCRCLRDRRSVSQRRYGGASISRPEGGRSFHYNLFI